MASWPDMIPERIHKDLADVIVPILTIIFQRNYNLGEVSGDWKSASVTPLFKKKKTKQNKKKHIIAYYLGYILFL